MKECILSWDQPTQLNRADIGIRIVNKMMQAHTW